MRLLFFVYDDRGEEDFWLLFGGNGFFGGSSWWNFMIIYDIIWHLLGFNDATWKSSEKDRNPKCQTSPWFMKVCDRNAIKTWIFTVKLFQIKVVIAAYIE